MKIAGCLLVALAFFPSCTIHEIETKHVVDIKPLHHNFGSSPAAQCMDKVLNYREQVPQNLRGFALDIGKTSQQCGAERQDVQSYVEKIIARHGDKP